MSGGIAATNGRLEGNHPRDIVLWASEEFGDGLVMSSSFQTESLALLHMISEVAPDLPVVFLKTGYHFPETIEFRNRVVEELDLNLHEYRGDKEKEHVARARSSGRPLYQSNPDTCCQINKVEPMNRALAQYDAWITGIRRDQSDNRSDIDIVEKRERDIIRVHPMAAWKRSDVLRYIDEHNLPKHPLTSEGYASIGCAPCTEPPQDGDPRSGRWQGTDKTECGLHTENTSDGDGD